MPEVGGLCRTENFKGMKAVGKNRHFKSGSLSVHSHPAAHAGAPNIQPLESVYSQPHINWTLSDENMHLWRPGRDETSGDSWEYLDLLNADHVGGEKGEV